MTRPILTLVGVILILLAVVVLLDQCDDAEQVKHNEEVSEALLDAVEDASEVAEKNAEEDAGFYEIVEETKRLIEEGEDEKVSRNATIAALCKLPNYSGDPACAVSSTNP